MWQRAAVAEAVDEGGVGVAIRAAVAVGAAVAAAATGAGGVSPQPVRSRKAIANPNSRKLPAA
jgi:hypothetical protein